MRTRKNKTTLPEKAALLPDSEKAKLADYGAVTTANNHRPTSFNDLPSELLYEIFKYLPFPSFMNTRSVCRRFLEACSHNALFRIHQEKIAQIAKRKSSPGYLPFRPKPVTPVPTENHLNIARVLRELTDINEVKIPDHDNFDKNAGCFPNVLACGGLANNASYTAAGTTAFLGSVIGGSILLFSHSTQGQVWGKFLLATGVMLYMGAIAFALTRCCASNSDRNSSSDEGLTPPRPKHDALQRVLLGPYYSLRHIYRYSLYKRRQNREATRHHLIRKLEPISDDNTNPNLTIELV